MKPYIKYIAGLVLIASVAACSDDIASTPAAEEAGTPIRLNMAFSPVTKASIQDSAIADGQQIAVYCDTSDYRPNSWTHYAPAQYFGAWIFTGANGALSSPDGKRFPPNNRSVDLYALNDPGGTIVKGDSLPKAVTKKTLTTQQDNDALLNSDLIYGTLKNKEQTPESFTLRVYHMLAKIQVKIIPAVGFDYSNLEGCTIELLGAPSGYTFTPAKVTDTVCAVQTARDGMVAAESTTTSVLLSNTVLHAFEQSDDWTEAIIPMKTYSSGDNLFCVTINTGFYKGSKLYYKLDRNLKLEGGKAYKFKLTATPAQLKGTFTLTGWGTGATDTYAL